MFGGEPKVGSEAFKSMITGVFKVTLFYICLPCRTVLYLRCMLCDKLVVGTAASGRQSPRLSCGNSCGSQPSPLTQCMLS